MSWKEVLLSLRGRGLEVAAKLAIADGTKDCWSALSEVYPQTQEQRCRVHKIKNVQDKLPRSLHGKLKVYDHFVSVYEAKYPKAVGCLSKDKDILFSFYNYPGENRQHNSHNESDRAGVCHGAFRHEANERLWQPASDAGDGLEILLRGAEELTKAARL